MSFLDIIRYKYFKTQNTAKYYNIAKCIAFSFHNIFHIFGIIINSKIFLKILQKYFLFSMFEDIKSRIYII